MYVKKINRRDFVKSSLSTLALTSIPVPFVFAQTTIRVRPEWQQFRTGPNYTSFINAIRTMRANTNANDRSSWTYWTNVHLNYCPHGTPYFLGWHRGYLYYFEQQLRTVSGNPNLVLPYWDYYRNPNIPAEFTDAARGNPLYVPRVNTNVYNALWLAPFDASVWNFQRGLSNAFEPLIEEAPHNPVHNIIGTDMATLASPRDPIFYLHHANIDRLWHAWALPDGKGIPSSSAPYWSGNFTYARNLTLPRSQCYHPNWVGTDYADVSKPAALPPQAQGQEARVLRVQSEHERTLSRPPVGPFPAFGPRSIGRGRRVLGGATGVDLSETSVSARVPVEAADSQALQGIVLGARGRGRGAPPAGPYQSAQIVLDNVRVLPAGMLGGYFYTVYLNLPESGSPTESPGRYRLGTVGPFELAGAAHHGAAQLVFPATEVLANVAPENIRDITVSLVRVSGANSPKGRTISIGEIRVELSTDPPFIDNPQYPKPANNPYR